MNNRLKALLVGFGDMGKKHHFPVLQNRDGIEVTGIVRKKRCIDNYFNIPIFNSINEAYSHQKPDVVIISTPHRYHYEQAKFALESGCHTLLEKPIALNFKEAQELVEIATRKKLLFVIGLQRRYETVGYIWENINREHNIGDILHINMYFAHKFGSNMESWRNDPQIAGAGVLDDSAIHMIDLASFIIKEPLKLESAQTIGFKQNPHTVSCILKTKTDKLINISVSNMAPGNSVQEEISIIGTKGALLSRRFRMEWDITPPEIYYKSSDGNILKSFDLSRIPGGRKIPLIKLLDVLQKNASPKILLSTASECLSSHKVLWDIKNQLN